MKLTLVSLLIVATVTLVSAGTWPRDKANQRNKLPHHVVCYWGTKFKIIKGEIKNNNNTGFLKKALGHSIDLEVMENLKPRILIHVNIFIIAFINHLLIILLQNKKISARTSTMALLNSMLPIALRCMTQTLIQAMKAGSLV